MCTQNFVLYNGHGCGHLVDSGWTKCVNDDDDENTPKEDDCTTYNATTTHDEGKCGDCMLGTPDSGE